MKANTYARLVLAALLLAPLVFWKEFVDHFWFHMSGSVTKAIVEGEWMLVAFNVAVFAAFLIPLSYRRKAHWGEYGLVGAFFVSLFIEMYGVPLTLYFAATMLGGYENTPNVAYSTTLMGVALDLTYAMTYALALMTAGAIIIAASWITLYMKKDEGLVTSGLYTYSRNPQYLGFMLVVYGWFIGWPTPLTLFFAPALIWKYYGLCRKEQKEVRHHKGFGEYRKNTPLII